MIGHKHEEPKEIYLNKLFVILLHTAMIGEYRIKHLSNRKIRLWVHFHFLHAKSIEFNTFNILLNQRKGLERKCIAYVLLGSNIR